METIKQFLTSSDSPEKVSLTIKSLAAFLILFGFDNAVLNDFGSNAASLVAGLGMVISSATALYGLFRKARLGRWSAPVVTRKR